MDNNLNFIITLSDVQSLIRVAIKLHPDDLEGDAAQYPLEPENRKQFKSLLPSHCSSFGEIVEVSQIFDIIIK